MYIMCLLVNLMLMLCYTFGFCRLVSKVVLHLGIPICFCTATAFALVPVALGSVGLATVTGSFFIAFASLFTPFFRACFTDLVLIVNLCTCSAKIFVLLACAFSAFSLAYLVSAFFAFSISPNFDFCAAFFSAASLAFFDFSQLVF